MSTCAESALWTPASLPNHPTAKSFEPLQTYSSQTPPFFFFFSSNHTAHLRFLHCWKHLALNTPRASSQPEEVCVRLHAARPVHVRSGDGFSQLVKSKVTVHRDFDNATTTPPSCFSLTEALGVSSDNLQSRQARMASAIKRDIFLKDELFLYDRDDHLTYSSGICSFFLSPLSSAKPALT